MAKRQKPLVGLDIDPVGISATQVSLNGGLTMTTTAYLALEPGVVRDGEVADVEALTEALKTLYRDNKGLDRRVRVGVANQKIVVRTIELPPIADRKELDAAVRFQAQDEIPMPLDQAVLDWQPLDIIEVDGVRRQRILLVAARRDMIERVVAAVKGAGLRLAGVDLGALAMIRALGSAEQTGPVLYADVGGITNLAVANGDQCLFTRASGAGVEGLAIELAERRGLTLEHARGWLVHAGLLTPLEQLEGDAEILADARSVLEDGARRIASEIRQSLDFHRMQSASGADVDRAVMTGRAIAIPGFVEAVGADLGLPIVAGSVAGAPEGVTAGELTIAAGLAIDASPRANLLPAEERRAAGTGGRSGGAVYAVLGVLALALLLVAAATMAGSGISGKRDHLARTTQDAAQKEALAQSLQGYVTFASLRQGRVSAVRTLVQSRFDWAHALGEVSRTIPSNVWLTSLKGSSTPDGGAPNAAVGPSIAISGCTTSMSNVAAFMSQLRRIDGVTRVRLEASDKTDVDSGSSAGGDCRGTHDQFPLFAMTIFLTAPSAAPVADPASPTTIAATGAAGTGTTPAPVGTAPAPATPTAPTSTGATQ